MAKTASKKRAVTKADEITVRQVQRYYALLCDMDMDKWLTEGIKLRNEKVERNGRKPKKASDQLKGDDVEFSAEDLLELSVHIDLGKMLTVFGQGGFSELVQIVYDCSEEEAGDVNLKEFNENFTDFVMESLKPIGTFLAFGQGLG